MKYLFIAVVLCSLVFGSGITPVLAYGSVDNLTDTEPVPHEASLEQMEQIIALLKQVVALLIIKRDMPEGSPIIVPIEIIDEA